MKTKKKKSVCLEKKKWTVRNTDRCNVISQ